MAWIRFELDFVFCPRASPKSTWLRTIESDLKLAAIIETYSTWKYAEDVTVWIAEAIRGDNIATP